MVRSERVCNKGKSLLVLSVAFSLLLSLGLAIELPNTVNKDSSKATASINLKSEFAGTDKPVELEYIVDKEKEYRVLWEQEGEFRGSSILTGDNKGVIKKQFNEEGPITAKLQEIKNLKSKSFEYKWEYSSVCPGGPNEIGDCKSETGKDSNNPEETRTLVYNGRQVLPSNLGGENNVALPFLTRSTINRYMESKFVPHPFHLSSNRNKPDQKVIVALLPATPTERNGKEKGFKSLDELKEETGLDDSTLKNSINRLHQQEIIRAGRGGYYLLNPERYEVRRASGYSSAQFGLTKMEDDILPADVKGSTSGTLSIHDLDVDLKDNNVQIHHSNTWKEDGADIDKTINDSGSSIPVDGDWHTIAELDMSGTNVNAKYQAEFNRYGDQIWMKKRMKARSGGGGHIVHSFLRVNAQRNTLRGRIDEVETLDKSRAFVTDKNKRGSIAFDKNKYKPGEDAKLRYWIDENVSRDVNLRVDWYSDLEKLGNGSKEQEKKGSTSLTGKDRQGFIEAPELQGGLNIRAELMLETPERDLKIDESKVEVGGSNIYFPKDTFPYNKQVGVKFHLDSECGEDDTCKVEWYNSNRNKLGENSIREGSIRGQIPQRFREESGIIEAVLKRNGNTLAKDQARIEAKFGRLETDKDSYYIDEEVTVKQFINSEGIYRMDFYLDGKKVAGKKITKSRGSKTHIFKEAGDAKVELIQVLGEEDKEEIVVDSEQFSIEEHPVSANDLPAWAEFTNDSFKPAKEPVTIDYKVTQPGYYKARLNVDNQGIREKQLPMDESEGTLSFNNLKHAGPLELQVLLRNVPEDKDFSDKNISETLKFQKQHIRNRSDILNLHAGWNMLSTPQPVSMEGIENDCGLIEFQGFKNWYYKGGDWKHSNVLNPGTGYFVSLETECEAVLEPSYHRKRNIRRKISRGWNMISTPFNTTLNEIKNNCRLEKFKEHKIWHYTGSGWNNPGTNSKLHPAKGYYVKSKNNCELSLTSRTGSKPEPPLPEAKEASNASECIKVNKGLCSCSSGGETIAIHQDYKDDWESYQEELADYRPKSCAGVNRCRDTEITLKDGKCTLE